MLAKKQLAAAAALGGLLCANGAQAYQLNDDVQLKLKIYTDLLFHSGDTANIESKDGVRFRRAYLTVKGRLSDRAKVRLTLDQKSLTSDETGQDKVFVKYVYLDYAVAPQATVRFGQGGTPYVGFDEDHLWRYRWIAKSFTDEWGLQTSSDLGLSLLGRAGGLRYQISFLDGEGYQHTPDGNGFAFAGRADFAPLPGLLVGAWFHNESQRNGVSGYDPSRVGVFVRFERGIVRASAQYAVADDGSNTSKFNNGKGYNVQGDVALGPGKLVLRWDSMDAKDNGADDTLLLGGYAFKLTKGVDLAIVGRQDTNKEPNQPDVTDSSYGLIAQVKL